VSKARLGTYSIVARDPGNGELGVAVQSHWFSVGSIVSWARAGVGAVATQSIAEPAYGPRVLDRLANGEHAGAALGAELAGDSKANVRQVGAVAASGAAVAHTGSGCVQYAGHLEADGFAVQANMMRSEEVWPAMARAFRDSQGPLARRLLATLEAGESAGGDLRGRQSAALRVVPASGEPWELVVELRVEDDPEPLAELGRLLDLHDAYVIAERGDELAGAGRHAEAGRAYREAAALAPENPELMFWAGLALAHGGEVEAGADRVRRAIELHEGWRELLARIGIEIAPGADSVRRALGIARS
jgi:uncharacterized Ntn-hydrolase superfamily protein